MRQPPISKTRPPRDGNAPGCEDFLLPPHVTLPVRQWYCQAVDNRLLSSMDCQTIRDLLILSGLDRPPESIHALLIALFIARNQGSVCLPLAKPALARMFATFAGDDASDLASHLTASLPRPACPGSRSPLPPPPGLSRWSDDGQGNKPPPSPPLPPDLPLAVQLAPLVSLHGDAVRPLVLDRNHLYFQKYHLHERDLAGKLADWCRTAPKRVDDKLAPTIAAVATYRRPDGMGAFSLTDGQKLAVFLACRNQFTIVSGGPGTGKTTLVASLVRTLAMVENLDPARVCLIAPTGRAGQRMGESLHASLASAVPGPEENLKPLRALTGSTIHRVLKYNPGRHAFTHGPANRIPYDLVVCDEVSMVDMILMNRLLSAIPDGARVVFLGDKDQLPSVEAGAVLGDLVPRDCKPGYSTSVREAVAGLLSNHSLTPASACGVLTDRVVLLDESHRTTGAVWAFAEAANAGDAKAVENLSACPRAAGEPTAPSPAELSATGQPPPLPAWDKAAEASCNLIVANDRAARQVKELGVSWSWHYLAERPPDKGPAYRELVASELPEAALTDACAGQTGERLNAAFERLASARILTVARRGPFGCDSLNRHLAKTWRAAFAPQTAVSSPVFAGMPIMITRNDHFHGLYNGNLGIVQKIAGDPRHVAVFQRGEGKFLILPVERLPDWEAAFAITVHKSQGSEYDHVLLIMPDDKQHPLLTREILYTGATRSRNKVFILADADILQTAIGRRIERFSGINLWNPENAPSCAGS